MSVFDNGIKIGYRKLDSNSYRVRISVTGKSSTGLMNSIRTSLQNDWVFVLSLLSIYVITKRLWPRYSIVFTALAGVVLCPVFLDFHMPTLHWSLARPVWISPVFSWSALLGLALPLFVISMASQYLPGIAMIKSYGYKPHVNQLIGWTGLTQVVLAPFGCYSVNIAAIHIVDENNVFKPLHELRIMFSKALASDRVITYCGGGIAASSDALILTMLGHQDVRIYDASLSEWARDESLPMETA